MATLMDTIKKNLTGEAPKAPELGQTQRVQGLLEAKTGKAIEGDTGPARTTIQEKSAAQQTQAGLQDQSLQNRLQFQGIQQQDLEQTAKTQEQQLNLADQLQDYQSAFERQTDSILGDFERDKRMLEDSRAASKVEQAGFLLRLQDQQYLSDLKQQGEMNRLNSSVGFKEAAFKSALEDSMDLFSSEQAFKTFSQSSDREFQNQLAQMDINFAMQMADKMATAQANQSIFSGLGTVVSGAASMYGNKSAAKPAEAAPAPAPPVER